MIPIVYLPQPLGEIDNDLIIIDQQEQEEYNKGNEHMYGYGYGYELTNNTAVAAVEGTKIASLARSISKRKCPI